MISVICGAPGEGKSYYMAQRIFQSLSEGRKVFTNFPFDGCHRLTQDDMEDAMFPEGAVLFIDEANSWWRNRERKDLSTEVFQLFMHHRHFHMDLFLIAQNPITLDINIRDIVQRYIWCSCFGIRWVDVDGYDYKHAIFFYYRSYATIEDMLSGDKEKSIAFSFELSRKSVFARFDSYYKFVEMNREKKYFPRWEELTGRPIISIKVNPYRGILHFIAVQLYRIRKRIARLRESARVRFGKP